MSETTDVKTVGREMILIMVAFGLLVQTILLLFQDKMYHSLGLWAGIAIGIASSIHMRVSLEDAMEQDEDGAVKYVRSRFVIRYLVTAVVLAAVIYLRIGSIVTVLIGIVGLKISAYLQPIIHKLLVKFKNNE